MCGIAGVLNLEANRPVERSVLMQMAGKLEHRGPDDAACMADGRYGIGFRRLSIIDLQNGKQPFFNHDDSVILICNGEIFNYKVLRKEMEAKGHVFKTNCDVEVLLYLYLQYGTDFLNKLNGQFAFAIYDKNKDLLFLGRDQFGICPLYYARVGDVFLFASEMKALLEYPGISKEIDLTGLDQIFTYPGNIFPTTFFKQINSLKPGHHLVLKDKQVKVTEYWDLVYPEASHQYENKPESYYIEQVDELLRKSIEYRLISDVPVGFYLSGGLDSSIVGALMRDLQKDATFNSFSICFSESEDNKAINEQRYQRIMSRHINSRHNEIEFNWQHFDSKLREVIYFSESPVKETYNICSLALSRRAREEKIKVVLSGEGADELFGGYAGYKFDQQREKRGMQKDLEHLLEDEVRMAIWGDPDFIYEKNENEFRNTKCALYSKNVNQQYSSFDCLKKPAIDHTKMRKRHIFHQRSYADFKLRLAGHLIADHGDRMTMANNVEGRYPFLDIDLIDFVRTIPPCMMVKNMTEKYILKQVAHRYLPKEIINREKFGFVAPGSPDLLKNNNEWVNDLLSYERIGRQGFFNPDAIERIRKIYSRPDFILNPPYDLDLLIIVLSFNIFLDVFNVPNLN